MKKKTSKAVALTYDNQKDKAPRVVAKGKGYLADKIIEIALKSGAGAIHGR